MQVILVKSVRKLGKVGNTVNVANGYGRNYLIPQELAIRATKKNIEKFASLQKDLQERNDKNKESAEKAAKSLNGKHFEFITQSASDGRLFGSVSLKSIAEKISEVAKIKLNYSNILLDGSIKFNGVYNVQVALHPEITVSVLVVVAKTESEAHDALMEYNQGGVKTAEKTKEMEIDSMTRQAQKQRKEIQERKDMEAFEAIHNSR
jgi:large subunit ribosomal protein L9